MTGADDVRRRGLGWRDRARRWLREMKAVLIGPPPRSAASREPWEHQQSYMQWLAENKQPNALRDLMVYWFAVGFVLVTVVGGILWFVHRSLGWM